MKSLPYGQTNFKLLRNNNNYYVEKTIFLPLLEMENNFLVMLRPQGFGKSLFISMMEYYYDLASKDDFEKLFGDLWIGQNPTPLASKYQILHFDFSLVGRSLSDLESNFNQYCCSVLDDFIEKYGYLYNERIVNKVIATENAVCKMDIITIAAKRLNHHLYLIIDEYDNFTKVILANYGPESFEQLTHAEGFYRNFFKHFKGTFERIFMAGFSPMTLDDFTSGYNINWNISNEEKFNSMLGFNETEVRQILEYYKDNDGLNIDIDIENALANMKPQSGNYCFALESLGRETVYNCDMTLYFLSSLLNKGIPPKGLSDSNITMDFSKIQLLMLPDNEIQYEDHVSTLEKIVERSFVDINLKHSFPVKELKERDNFLSLLYYFGLLTIGGGDSVMYHMIIPNEYVRLQHWNFLLKM